MTYISLKSYYWIEKLKSCPGYLFCKSYGIYPTASQSMFLPDSSFVFAEISLSASLVEVENHLQKRKYIGQCKELVNNIFYSKILHSGER